jgi:formylglycine-generating enzyme required for sulfatase activity
MAQVPAGWFIRGSARTDPEARPDETPQQLVFLDTYYLDRHPVTNADYERFVQAAGHRPPPHWRGGAVPAGQESHPVVCVNWYDAASYAAWTGKRLPTEAEWEQAACGGLLLDGATEANPMPWRRYPWGDHFDPGRCATSDSGVWEPVPVGAYSPTGDSPYGLVDMAGNVWEWVTDWYEPASYGAARERNPQGPTDGAEKVLRGGAAGTRGRHARCASRCALRPERVFSNNGFRCAWSPR